LDPTSLMYWSSNIYFFKYDKILIFISLFFWYRFSISSKGEWQTASIFSFSLFQLSALIQSCMLHLQIQQIQEIDSILLIHIILFVNDMSSSCDPSPRLWMKMTQMMVQAQFCNRTHAHGACKTSCIFHVMQSGKVDSCMLWQVARCMRCKWHVAHLVFCMKD